jgi:hypothetical protein
MGWTKGRHSYPKEAKGPGRLGRLLQLVAVGAIVSLVSAGVAFADNINDTIDSSGPVTLTAGDPSPTNNTARVFVVANGAGEPGCDIDPGETLTITFVTPSGITASPASVNFTACGGANSGQFHTVAFSASSSALSGNVTASITANSTGTASTTYNNNVSIPITVNQPPPPSDSTPPSIGYVLAPASPDGDNGWYKSNVSLTWTVSEPESPSSLQKTGCIDQNITSDQQEQTYSCSASSDGGSAGPVNVSIKRDATAPTIVRNASADSCSVPGDNGWCRGAQTAGFSAEDATSGLATDGAASRDFTKSTSSEGSAVNIASGPVSDMAGNSNAGIQAGPFKIDSTPPSDIQFVGGPAAGGSYYFGSVPSAPTCTADDALSGFDSCGVTGYSTSVGTHTMTATAKDKAGNTATATRSYTVLPWTLNGFYNPVDMGGVVNTVKNGSTVPLKFNVFAASEITDTAAIKQPLKAQQINCDTAAQVDEIEVTATGGTSLRYDSTGGQFIYNWQTPKKANTCWRVTVETQDGSKLEALFKLK